MVVDIEDIWDEYSGSQPDVNAVRTFLADAYAAGSRVHQFWLDQRDEDGDGLAECAGDCDERNPNVGPNQAEIPGDGIDQNCDGVDMSCDCPDADGDGYHSATCGGSDCNDSNWLINPGADEVCDNGSDDDCDGIIDRKSVV